MNTKQLKIMFMALVAMLASSCGLQVRDNPTVTSDNPVINQPAEKLYTVGGEAWKFKFYGADIPTGYSDNMPEGITLTLNGEELFLDEQGEFVFPNKLKDGEDYEVSILDDSIEIPSNNGISPSIYLNCLIDHEAGTIDNANVDDVYVTCHLSDSPI